MNRIVLIITLILFSEIGFAETESVLLPRFNIVGTPLLEVFAEKLDKRISLSVEAEHSLGPEVESVASKAKFDLFIYYNANQLYTNSGAKFGGQFSKQVKSTLRNKIKGLIFPISKSLTTMKIQTLDRILSDYYDEFIEGTNFEAIFLIECDLLRTLEQTKFYQKGKVRYAYLPDVHRGKSMKKHTEDFLQHKEMLNQEWLVPVDLRKIESGDEEDFKSYLSLVEDRNKIVIFKPDSDSMSRLANYFDLVIIQ